MTIGWSAVATNLASLSPISGIVVKDFSNIPADCRNIFPILYPNPSESIKSIHATRHGLTLNTGRYRLEYYMTWRYIHSPVGSVISGQFTDYANFVLKMDALYSAILTNMDMLAGANNNIWLPDLPKVGGLTDFSGNAFHGCDLEFKVSVEL
jgi:hypothetical protein